MWTVDPKIPLSLWWAILIAAVVAIAWYVLRREWAVSAGRRWVLSILLGLGVVGPLLIALNPTWVQIIPPVPGQPMLTVLVDGTISMKTEDCGANTDLSRWSQAVDLAGKVNSEGHRVEVRKMAFGELVKPLDTGNSNGGANSSDDRWPQGHRSDLAAALRQTTRAGSPVGHAVLMISDGAHNVGSTESVLQTAREANAMATPIYTVTLGSTVGMKNMSIVAKSQRMIAFPNNPIAIRAILGHNGLAGQSTQVQLLRDEEVLQTQTVRLQSEPTQEIRFNIEQGAVTPIQRYRIVASELFGEATTADNQTTVLVQRLNEPIGVLVLEGKPYWDSKFLARNLASDPVVQLTTLVKLGPGRFLQRKMAREASSAEDATSGEPKFVETTQSDWTIEKDLKSPLESTELLERFRLVILGRDASEFLTDVAIDNLRSWMSKSGGCLLCSRGAPSDQIGAKFADILPVRWTPASESRVRAEVTQHGLDTSVFDPLMIDGFDPVGTLPTLAVGAVPKQRQGLPQVLMQSTVNNAADSSNNTIPIVTYQPFGGGQSIVVEGAGMWRWAFLPPQHASKDKIYPTLWQSLVQWIISQQDMMPGQEVAIRPDRATFLSGDRASCSVTLRNPAKWNADGNESSLSILMQSPDSELPKRFSITPSGIDSSLFRGELGALEVGYYALKVVQGTQDEVLAATAFEVRDPWFESLEVDARPDVMRQISRLSGGEVLQPEQVPELVARFEEQILKQQKHEETRTSMWDHPLVLITILLGWISTWVVRRQSGLV